MALIQTIIKRRFFWKKLILIFCGAGANLINTQLPKNKGKAGVSCAGFNLETF
jgi:hypothetical protein